jgi:ubiquinone/menaquinone biosynthesis C-methylase UbiE/DNA-binding transcriptional ArsR family regulator
MTPSQAILPIAELTGIFKLLSDETRLRILALVRDNELAVGELQKILGAGQSTLSTQLGALKEAGLVTTRKEGQKVFYRIPESPESKARRVLIDQALGHIGTALWRERDLRSLHKVLENRAESSRAFFNTQAVQNMPSPGQTWKALAQGVTRLLRGERIVDLGCGNGRLALMLAEAGNAVTGVDHSEEQIKLARKQAGQVKNPVFLQAPMEATGLPSAAFTLAILSQSLHHAAKPESVVTEAARLVAPGGRLLVLDLLAHDQEWLRSKFGDFWLGFAPDALRSWMENAGLKVRHSEITAASKAYPDIEGLMLVAEKKLSEKTETL